MLLAVIQHQRNIEPRSESSLATNSQKWKRQRNNLRATDVRIYNEISRHFKILWTFIIRYYFNWNDQLYISKLFWRD